MLGYSTVSLNPVTSSRGALLRVSHHEAYGRVSRIPLLARVPAFQQAKALTCCLRKRTL